MGIEKSLTFYLEAEFLERAMDGKVNVVNQIVSAFESKGFDVDYQYDTEVALLQSAQNPGYSMFHMEHPFHVRALTLRRAYFYPFWQIESSGKRWEWEVAKAKFRADQINWEIAHNFVHRWRKWLFDSAQITGKNEGYVFVPLQGRLLEKRSFQCASPIEMVKATAVANPDRDVIVTLHPKETYLEAEREALDDLISQHTNLRLVTGDAVKLVARCDYIVTQNSSLAMVGYFHEKPVVLFGQIDFHHIGINAHSVGIEQAFELVKAAKPDFVRYLYWFLQLNTINAGRDDAEQQIIDRVQARGWVL